MSSRTVASVAASVAASDGGSPRRMSLRLEKKVNAVALIPNNNDSDEEDEPLMALEGDWLRQELSEAVTKTKQVISSIKAMTQAEKRACDGLAEQRVSLKEFLKSPKAMEVAVNVFKVLVGEDHLKLLLHSEDVLAKEDEESVATARMNRHKSLVNKTLTVIKDLPEAEVGAQVLQDECKKIWSFVCKSSNLELDGTPKKKKAAAAAHGRQKKKSKARS